VFDTVVHPDFETRGLDVNTMEIIETDLFPYQDLDDGKDHMTHVINQRDNIHIWQPGMSSQDIVDTARMTGQWIFALCGYKFIPERDPQKYPACQACFDIAGQIMNEDG